MDLGTARHGLAAFGTQTEHHIGIHRVVRITPRIDEACHMLVLGRGRTLKGKTFVGKNVPRRGKAHPIGPFGYIHLNVPYRSKYAPVPSSNGPPNTFVGRSDVLPGIDHRTQEE